MVTSNLGFDKAKYKKTINVANNNYMYVEAYGRSGEAEWAL
jgi:hypothetical protein